METDDETFLFVKEIDPPEPDPELVKNVKPLEEGKGQIEEKEKESLSGKYNTITVAYPLNSLLLNSLFSFRLQILAANVKSAISLKLH